MKVLLVEPNYRSTFPPLGLLRISSYLKSVGISPTFVRGMDKVCQSDHWEQIYISSLFTYELPRTVKTINFYQRSVNNPEINIIVGGVGATLLPNYLAENSTCRIITGPLCNPDMLGLGEPPIANFIPDYEILKMVSKHYVPDDAYFVRISTGCVRNCSFCAVPVLEPNFGYLQNLTDQMTAIDESYGIKHDLIILDNNILALNNAAEVLQEIKRVGFYKGSVLNGRKRFVDFNQGLDIRFITPSIAKLLSELAVRPVRIAFDNISIENRYKKGIKILAENGITNIMTYVMYNFNDSPEDFYRRLQVNAELSETYGVRITGFPMRYCPIADVDRHYISPKWNWRYLRGIQCILNATHGIVSPNPEFFRLSFGNSYDEFSKIVSMPDEYILYRSKHREEINAWNESFSNLNDEQKGTFYKLLEDLHNHDLVGEIEDEKISEIIQFYIS